jgi:hypothetical protein
MFFNSQGHGPSRVRTAPRRQARHVVRNDGTVIHVRHIDLQAPEDEILRGIAEVARLVERIAAG